MFYSPQGEGLNNPFVIGVVQPPSLNQSTWHPLSKDQEFLVEDSFQPIMFALLCIFLVATTHNIMSGKAEADSRFRPSSWTLHLTALIIQLIIGVCSVVDVVHYAQRYLGYASPNVTLGIRILTTLTALLNVTSISLGRSSTTRAVYHFVIGGTWAWMVQSKAHSGHQLDQALPWLFAAAFSVDIFTYTTTSKGPPSRGTSGYGLFERATYSWVDAIIRQNANIELDHLPNVPLPPNFSAIQTDFLDACGSSKSPTWTVFYAFLFRHYTAEMLRAAALRVVADLSTIGIPWLLRLILKDPSLASIAMLFGISTVGAMCDNYCSFLVRRIAVEYKSMLSAALLSKTLRLSEKSSSSSNNTDVSTLSEVDTLRLFRAVMTYMDIWSCPLQLVLCIVSLILLLPWEGAVLVLLVMVLMIPILGTVVKRVSFWIGQNMQAKDWRTKLTTEVLSSIQAVKMHGWESALAGHIGQRRAKELRMLQNEAIANSCLVCLMQSTPALLTLVALGVFVVKGILLDAEHVFVNILLLTMINNSLIKFSTFLNTLQATATSVDRFRDYLNIPEIGQQAEAYVSLRLVNDGGHFSLQFTAPSYEWSGVSDASANTNISFVANSITLIVGSTGSGKTRLLASMLQAIESMESDEIPLGGVAHTPQTPFMIGGTIRDNILFGKPFDKTLYETVLTACCLTADLSRLKQGDKTQLGGSVGLSGGQKSRVTLARAAYSEAKIYLLDDPFAAIDNRTKEFMTHSLLGKNGLLRHATVIITCNGSDLAHFADMTYSLERGVIRRLPQSVSIKIDGVSEGQAHSTPQPAQENIESSMQRTLPKLGLIEETIEVTSSDASLEVADAMEASSSHSIWRYIFSAKSVGWPLSLGLLLSARLTSLCGTYTLKMMASTPNVAALQADLLWYALFSTGQTIFFFVFILTLYRFCILPAATRIHLGLISSILSLPMSVFESGNIGDVLNLFTNDLARIDHSLNASLISLAAQYLNLFISCTVLLVSSPISICFVIPMAGACIGLQKRYLDKLRSLRRIDANTRSPLLSHLREASDGRTLIRLHRFTTVRIAQFEHLILDNMRPLLPLCCIELWLAFRLQMASVSLQCLGLKALLFAQADLNTIGFTMTYLFQLTTILSAIAQVGALLEADMVSLARIYEHTATSSEEIVGQPKRQEGSKPPPEEQRLLEEGQLSQTNYSTISQSWPTKGKIQFSSVVARYQASLPPSLKSLTVTIEPGEKVAVVGRTGAGKSSLVLSLLGMMEVSSGSITIDGLDISNVPPSTLRHAFALVPQQPLVLSLTLRENLDPLNNSSDSEIMAALRESNALHMLQALPSCDDLGSRLSENVLDLKLEPNSMLSVGQTRMLSLARARLQKSRILILDEASSNLDEETESYVNETIFGKFQGTTVISVMHKLKSLTSYDKVLVLSAGTVVAYDTVEAILGSQDENLKWINEAWQHGS